MVTLIIAISTGLCIMLGMIGYSLDMIRFALERIERKIK